MILYSSKVCFALDNIVKEGSMIFVRLKHVFCSLSFVCSDESIFVLQ
jgi:hypothetical protein